MKLIVNTNTGWIIDADDSVYVLDTDHLNDDDRRRILTCETTEIVDVAKDQGRKLNSDTLDLTFSNTIAFSENAIIEEANNSTVLDLNENLRDWVVNFATHEDFELIANAVLSDDRIWEAFPSTLKDAIIEIHTLRVLEGVAR